MTLFAVPDFPLVQPGDDIAALIVERLSTIDEALQPTDIIVMAQKIVSKAEGRLVRLKDVVPDDRSHEIAAIVDKDPRVVQVVLDDSRAVIRQIRGVLITEHQSGWLCANAGVDRSNVEPTAEAKRARTPNDGVADHGGVIGESESDVLALLPVDSDISADRIRNRIIEITGFDAENAPAVLINDSHGRPWRVGTVGVCIGCAGLPALWDQRGLHDLFGYELVGSEECIADELCAAASLLMGQSDEGTPVVIVRNYRPPNLAPTPACTIQRDPNMDLFR